MENTIGIDWRDWVRRSMPQIVIGAVIGAGALALALRHIDWNGVGNALRNTRPSMLLAALLLTFVTLVLSTTRWWLLFTPEHHERNWWVLGGAILIGQTANVVMPGRVGEIARMFLVGTRERVSKARVGATIVVEKVTDLAVFAVFTGYVLVAMTLPSWMMRSGTALTVTSALLVVITVVLSSCSNFARLPSIRCVSKDPLKDVPLVVLSHPTHSESTSLFGSATAPSSSISSMETCSRSSIAVLLSDSGSWASREARPENGGRTPATFHRTRQT